MTGIIIKAFIIAFIVICVAAFLGEVLSAKTCSQCGKKFFFKSPNGKLCRACYNKQEAESLRRKQEEKDRQIAEAKEAFLLLEDKYEIIQSMRFDSGINQIKQNLALCDSFDASFRKYMNMPYMSESVHLNPDFQFSFVKVGKFGLLPFKKVENGQVEVNFDKVIDLVSATAEKCRTFIKNSDKFLKDKDSLHLINFRILPDPGEREASPRTLLVTSNLTARTSLAKISNFIAIDVETTGLSPSRNEIIELAAVKFVNFIPEDVFHAYIKPRHGLNEDAQRINHITEEMLANAPYIEQILPALGEYLEGGVTIVGHNLPFDYGFLTAKGWPFGAGRQKFYDTLDIGKREYGLSKYTLDFLCEKVLKIARDDAHSAISDALIAGYLFRDICDRRVGGIYSQFCAMQ